MDRAHLTAGGVAKAAQVNVETLRFYEREGLLPEPTRAPNGYRRYDHATLRRLRFIRAAQELGFALAEIRELLRLDDVRECEVAGRLARTRLERVERQIAGLLRLRSLLRKAVRGCESGKRERCPLIVSLSR